MTAKKRLYLIIQILMIVVLIVNDSLPVVVVTAFERKDNIQVQQQELTIVQEEDKTQITLAGILPKDITAEAEIVEAEEYLDVSADEVLYAYDISLYSENEEYEPLNGAVQVSISGVEIAQAYEEGRELQVYHIPDGEDAVPELIEEVSVDGDTISFQAESFSVYIIKEHEEGDVVTPRHFYYFLDRGELGTEGVYTSSPYMFQNKADDLVNLQIIKDGESLSYVPTPHDYKVQNEDETETSYQFMGWYNVQLEEDGYHNQDTVDISDDTYQYKWINPVRQEFETPVTVTEDAVYYLAPLYSNQRFVTFHEDAVWKKNSNGTYGPGTYAERILTRKLAALDSNGEAKVLISDIYVPQPDATHEFYYCWESVQRYDESTKEPLDYTLYVPESDGWKVITYKDKKEVSSESYQDSDGNIYITLSADTESIDLYPVFRAAHWLYFIAGDTGSGADYVSARLIWDNENVEKLPVSERYNYKFCGWYTGTFDENTGTITRYDKQITDETGKVLNNVSGLAGAGVENGKLSLTEDLTLYGKWEEKKSASYTIVVWMQKVTDDKNAADENKHYDYETSYKVTDAVTGAVPSALDYEKKNYTGFHYNKTVRTSETIKADGSTVVNVYYDRDLMVINFYYRSSDTAPANAADAYTYTVSTNTNSNYGIVDGQQYGQYVELTRGEEISSIYSYTTKYTYEANSTANKTTIYYGIVDKEYVKLEHKGSKYFYNNSEYTQTRYIRSDNGTSYTGTRYTKSGTNAPYQYDIVMNDIGIQYGLVNGGYIELVRSITPVYKWYYNGNEYTGTRYTRGTAPTYSTGYGRNMPYNKMVTYTGLYNQTFEQNHYEWPKNYSWEEIDGSTTQTLLTGFTVNDNPYNLSCTGTFATNANSIYHYWQGLDGKYSLKNGEEAKSSVTSGNLKFNFSNKMNGFTVSSYSTGSNGFSENGGTIDITSGDSKDELSLPLHVYHSRNSYNLIFDYNIPEGENGAGNNATYSVQYEEDLQSYVQYDSTLNTYVLSKNGNPTREHRHFVGWYAEPECVTMVFFATPTEEELQNTEALWETDDDGSYLYNENGTHKLKQYIVLGNEGKMPASHLKVYAKWDSDWFKVTLEPNGGEIKSASSMSTWFWAQYGDTVKEYKITRPYVAASDGTYYYVKSTNNSNRSQMYVSVTEFGEVAKGEHGTKAGYTEWIRIDDKKYKPDPSNPSTYSLLGWYEVLNAGTASEKLSTTPYSFSDVVDHDITLRAVWRTGGTFTIYYDGNQYKEGSSGNTEDIVVAGTALQPVDPIASDSQRGGYTDQAITVILPQPPEYNSDKYIFEGWRVVDKNNTPIQFNIVTGKPILYQPGDDFWVDASLADENNIIHLHAYYSDIDQSLRVPDVTKLILDANHQYGNGYVVWNGNEKESDENGTEYYIVNNHYEYIKIDKTQYLLKDEQLNEAVYLSKYRDYFKSNDGYLLLGWNHNEEPGEYVPEYYANGVIGIDNGILNQNFLYALWEPMIYITFKNQTEDAINFNLSTDYGGDTFVVNEYISLYERKKYDISTTITLEAGSELKLVMPKGEGYRYTVGGSYNKNGTTLYVYNSGGDNAIVANSGNFSVSGQLIKSQTGRVIIFSNEEVEDEIIPAPTNYNDISKPFLALLLFGILIAVTAVAMNQKRKGDEVI